MRIRKIKDSVVGSGIMSRYKTREEAIKAVALVFLIPMLSNIVAAG